MTDTHDYSASFTLFAEFIKGLVEPLDALVILAHDGQERWRKSYSERGREWTPNAHDADAKTLDLQQLRIPVERSDGEPDDHLCALLDHNADSALLTDLLNGLMPIVNRHNSLDHELVTMTDELVRRYEELTLVYDNDDGLGSVEENERFLSRIIDNCTDSLDVRVTALLLRDRERSIVRHGSDADKAREVGEWLNNSAMTRWLENLKTPVVVNESSERWQNGLSLDCPLKLIACPLINGKNNRYGTLLVARSEEQRDFENSDRNIMVMLAEKATRIVGVKYDALTGLLTREGFERCIEIALREAASQQRRSTSLHVNVDQLKLVNDTFGHEIGDDLLQRIAKRLGQGLRTKDRLARVGGDEFGILLPDSTLDEGLEIAQRMCAAAAKTPCKVGTRQLDVGVSIGVVQITADMASVVEAMALADLTCAVAKEEGRSRAVAYRASDTRLNARKDQMHWVGRIQRAIKSDGFNLYCQPIVATAEGTGPSHFEVLLRMQDEDGSPISPGLFMPVAERYQIMPALDRWVVEKTIKTLGQWAPALRGNNAVFAVNLSGQSITDERTLDHLLDQLRASNFDTRLLCFEITETAAISNLSAAQDFIERVKEFGCQFALDDFGAGVSSFTNLRALQLDYLKIDGSFVVDMLTDPVSAAMVAAINTVGQTMSLATVAEFVESQAIQDALEALGVDYLQGYHLGKPRPLTDLLESLSESGRMRA